MISERILISLLPRLKLINCLMMLLGGFIQAVGLSSIHVYADVTEGGVLGATLLLEYWFGISPAVSSAVLNALCYFIGWKTMGRDFLWYSVLAGGGFSLSYALAEPFAPLWPWIIARPWAAAVFGAVFIGVGAGLAIRFGGAPGGDDALAMALNRLTKLDIQWIYLITDLSVLGLSLSYIPLPKLAWSLISVVLSGQIIGWIQKIPLPSGRK